MRRVLDKQMNVVVLAVALNKPRVEVGADLSEDRGKIADSQERKNVAAVFCDEDQVHM